MWIKRQEGYCLKEIAGVHYLLPYGQKVADQRKGIVLNETGVFLWNELQETMTDEELAVCSGIIVIGDFAGMFASLLCRGRG